MRDVAKLWSAGYALGASLENTLVVTDNRVLNPEGARFPDEFVRHKVLDAIGDLALAGAPLLGAYRSVRGGHKLNYAVLSALMADASAWTMVEAEPVRPVRGHADLAAGLAAAGLRAGRVLTPALPGIGPLSSAPHSGRNVRIFAWSGRGLSGNPVIGQRYPAGHRGRGTDSSLSHGGYVTHVG